MNIELGPNSVEEPNLLYKLQRKIQVFSTSNRLTNRGYSLVACSSKYGIVFVGSPVGSGTLSVYHLKDLTDKECEPLSMTVRLPEKPTHVAVNCDNELLAVTGGAALCVYKVTDFQNQNVSPVVSIRTDVAASNFVSSLQWNPCVPDTISIAFYDGILLVSQVTTGQLKKVQSKARCICWSPKGKQLVTGNSDGTLCQYKPDLTPAKMVPAPNLFEGSPVEALAIHWISTFQFAVVYKNAADNSRPGVTIVNTPKAGQPSCFNYEDICYSMGNNRPWYYYLIGLAPWNMILASSSNSMELATLGSQDSANWMQWCQSDEARPELPLTKKKIENYPVGVCIDTCAIHQLPWGENETLPHMPLLHVVSQSGLLTVFNIINLRKDAPQLCSPPQQIALPAAAMSNDIPNDLPPEPAQPAAPSAVAPKPQEASQPAQPAKPFSFAPAPAPAPAATSHAVKPFSFQQTAAQPQAFAATPAAPASQAAEKKQVEVKPVISIPQPQATPAQPRSQPAQQTPPHQPKPSSQAQEANAALKAEQEKINKLKADQELRSMLVKEVNDFQTELYKFAVKTREVQIKLQKNLESMNPNLSFQSLDAEKLKKDCAVEELRAAIIALKLELVRACAFVAEARSHAEAKNQHQWTQVDPLTTKRVASVKKLAYYVQNQVEQAHKALDYKWNEMATSPTKRTKPGQRMIRPVLDDVYQPLVRQQEILSRQQAVLRTLRNTLKECDSAPMFKSTSLLRSTPFKNKDPLSKLTKNILNMSIDPQTKTKEPALSAQKLDALRDMLSNHRPVKIKPASIEMQQHLAGMRLNYEKSIKEKVAQEKVEKSQAQEKMTVQAVVAQPVKTPSQPMQPAFPIAKPDLIAKQPPLPTPVFTPVNVIKPTVSASGLSNVARTLFTEPKSDQAKSPPVSERPMQSSVPQPKVGFAPPTSVTASANTRSVLKDMLQNKMANVEAKSDANTFMGQKICSPSAFAVSTPITQAQSSITLTSKPLTDINKMFSKFTPQSFAPDSKPQFAASTTLKKEYTEVTIKTEKQETEMTKKTEKQGEKVTNLFTMSTTKNVPDVLKTNTQLAPDKNVAKAGKEAEKVKENVPEKSEAPLVENDKKEEITVTATFKLPSKSPTPMSKDSSAVSSSETKKLVEEKPSGLSITIAKPNASSLFAAANAASPITEKPSLFGSPTSPVSSPTSLFASPKPDVATTPSESPKPALGASTTNASFLFSAAASQAQATAKTQSGSIFSSTPAFASTQGSMFGGSTTVTTTTPPTQSESGTPDSKPSVFSTPTPASPSALFASAAAITATTQSAFSASPTSVFASAAPTTQGSAFGSPSSPSATPSVFSGTATTTAPSLFSSTPSPGLFATTTTSQSLFGGTTTPTQSAFGAGASPSSVFSAATSAPAAFGTSTATTQASFFGVTPTAQSVFGGTPTTQATVFGAPATTQSSLFGTASPASPQSVFGAASTPQSVFGSASPPTVFGGAQPTQASVFGGAQTTQASVFGGAQTTPASVFGGSQTQASAFGAPATTASGSLFGNENNLFASASISTTSAPSPTSGGSIFGGPAATGSVFGSGNQSNVFGGKTAFGQPNPSATAIFGGGGATAFGQKPATSIWGSGSNNNATGGFGSSGFGQQATTQASSLFGGGSGSFSAPPGGQAFGSPQTGSVFGSPQQQNVPAFGSTPAFGSKPAFGQPAGFGASPSGAGFGAFSSLNKSPGGAFGAPAAFGGAAAFGAPAFGSTSPAKVFGGGGASPGFGAPTQSNATFESMATQNTLTFGNLAQQSPPQAAQPQPTFNASPSFTGWRG